MAKWIDTSELGDVGAVDYEGGLGRCVDAKCVPKNANENGENKTGENGTINEGREWVNGHLHMNLLSIDFERN